ncbi:hypothetical protein BJ742DRAFT_867696 [Cladochytrium replicatum]|nr:hypothetical protein BJ742DRAFT_867696 [Cladochytrium replicatum]
MSVPWPVESDSGSSRSLTVSIIEIVVVMWVGEVRREVGQTRLDPFAMLPFCRYNMGDYFSHWIATGAELGEKAPSVGLVPGIGAVGTKGLKGVDGDVMEKLTAVDAEGWRRDLGQETL